MTMPRRGVDLRSRIQNSMVVAWHGSGMGTVWARHGMFESTMTALCKPNEKYTI
jgi:hypothetical protein